MAFPNLTTLDDFTRADSPNLGANWTVADSANAMPIVSNTAGYDALPGLETWNVAQFTAGQQIWVTMATTLALSLIHI